MAIILTILIVAILNGCLAFVDQMLDAIVPLSLYSSCRMYDLIFLSSRCFYFIIHHISANINIHIDFLCLLR